MPQTHRELDPGLGMAVAKRTILRDDETWGDVADRVAMGNVALVEPFNLMEAAELRQAIADGVVLMSGRHLQHGDKTQPGRNLEVFTNCSTAAFSYSLFYLLLNGSGVGRSYDDDLMIVDWARGPRVICVLSEDHPDYVEGLLTPNELVLAGDHVVFRVPDSREGWAQALEYIEREAHFCTAVDVHGRETIVLDFSDVRPQGSPIAGMQGRPADGPVNLMRAIDEAMSFDPKWPRWLQALHIDHHLSAVVALGGSRRAARIAVKWWGDPDILDFIRVKQDGGYWSANNSVAVDADFWNRVHSGEERATEVFEAVTHAQYFHGTGEPGFVNVDQLHTDRTGMELYANSSEWAGSKKYTPSSPAMHREIANIVLEKRYPMIVNPCGEISLSVLGGYCVIGDWVPFHADSLEEARDAAVLMARALVRTNLMDSFYPIEVARTNRIGVGVTGIQEFAFKFFGLTFPDLLGLSEQSQRFWEYLESVQRDVIEAVDEYSDQLGVRRPHTVMTIKPSGSVSKLFGLSEGAHLPAMKEYLRWVQFQQDDPLIDEYRERGYPVEMEPGDYNQVGIVGFPTQPTICRIGIPSHDIVTAPEASMGDQYRWVRMLEQYWLGTARGNQVSYTLKYDRETTDFGQYQAMVKAHQPTVRCISVMPSDDWRTTKEKYGYVPEEPLEGQAFQDLVQHIEHHTQVVTLEELQCASGACPI